MPVLPRHGVTCNLHGQHKPHVHHKLWTLAKRQRPNLSPKPNALKPKPSSWTFLPMKTSGLATASACRLGVRDVLSLV